MPVIAAAAGLDLVMLALVGVILLAAAYMLFRPLIGGALGAIPFAGPWIANHVEDLLAATLVAAATPAEAALQPIADLFRRVAELPNFLLSQVAWTLERTLYRVWHVVAVELPGLEQRAAAHADQLAQLAIEHADQVAGLAIARADQEFAIAIAGAEAEFAAALARADQDAQQALAYAQALAAAGIVHADQLAHALEQQLAAGEDLQARYAEQLAAGAVQYTQAAVRDLEMQLEQLGAATQDYARQLERLAVGHADQVGAAVAAIAAAATGAVAARVTDLEDSPCQRFCSPLGDLGQLLQELEDAGLQALLLAVVAEVESDPGAIQQVLRQDVAPIFKQALGALV